MFKRARLLAMIVSVVMLLVGGTNFVASAAANDDVVKEDRNNTTYYKVSDEYFFSFYNKLLQQWGNQHSLKNVPSKGDRPQYNKKGNKWNNAKEEEKHAVEKEKEDVKQPEQQVEAPERPAESVPKPNTQDQKNDELNAFEWEMFELTNKERVNNGLQPLQVDVELSRVAREKSRDMASNYYFSHNSPVYGSPFDMMKSYGISYRTAGENIAKGQRTPNEVVQAWMNSPGHRANILNPNFTHIGVGYVEQGNHWTQQFIGK